MPSDDPRRVVVIDPATDNVTTIIGKAHAALGVGELRERILREIVNGGECSTYEDAQWCWSRVHTCTCAPTADAVLRVILGDSEAPS